MNVTLEGGPADGMDVTPPVWRAGPPDNAELFVVVLGPRAWALGAAPPYVMRRARGLETYVRVGPGLYIHRPRVVSGAPASSKSLTGR